MPKITEHLTSRQQEVLSVIEEFIEKNGVPPTRSELAQALGLKSVTAADEHIKNLAKKGAIRISPGLSRGIHIASQDKLPVIGQVAAGSPLLSEENIERYVRVDTQSFPLSADYLLKVNGDSMIGAGILDGDLLVVHKSRNAINGQVCVVRMDEEVTVKRFYREGETVKLVSENPDYAPIMVNPNEHYFRIEGIYLGVIRVDPLLA